MCEKHFRQYGDKRLAERMGNKFVKRVLKVVVKPEKMKSVTVPLSLDSVVYIKCPYCGTEKAVEPDANYIATCDGCGHKYRVISMI